MTARHLAARTIWIIEDQVNHPSNVLPAGCVAGHGRHCWLQTLSGTDIIDSGAIAVPKWLMSGVRSRRVKDPGIVKSEGGRSKAQGAEASVVVVAMGISAVSVSMSDVLISSARHVHEETGWRTWTQFNGSAARTSQWSAPCAWFRWDGDVQSGIVDIC
jgi:hypothetical protein